MSLEYLRSQGESFICSSKWACIVLLCDSSASCCIYHQMSFFILSHLNCLAAVVQLFHGHSWQYKITYQAILFCIYGACLHLIWLVNSPFVPCAAWDKLRALKQTQRRTSLSGLGLFSDKNQIWMSMPLVLCVSSTHYPSTGLFLSRLFCLLCLQSNTPSSWMYNELIVCKESIAIAKIWVEWHTKTIAGSLAYFNCHSESDWMRNFVEAWFQLCRNEGLQALKLLMLLVYWFPTRLLHKSLSHCHSLQDQLRHRVDQSKG